METVMSFDNVSKNQSENYHLEIASALLDYPDGNIMDDIFGSIKPNTTIFLPAMPNLIGMGDVASNFRFKHDATTNNLVVDRWNQLFEFYKKNKNPVVITTIGRQSRCISLKMNEDGTVNIINLKTKQSDKTNTDIFTNFLHSFNIDQEKMKIIREASSGAKYYSYLADMMGFINIINWNYNKSLFRKMGYEFDLETQVVNTTDVYHRKEVSGQKMLTPVTINGREWVPKDGFNYLYFNVQKYKSTPTSQTFVVFKEEHIDQLYQSLFDAISLEENTIKSQIRNYFNDVSFTRYSDFWLNDVDDAFTILMILNCYRYVELTEQEQIVKSNLEEISRKIGLI